MHKLTLTYVKKKILLIVLLFSFVFVHAHEKTSSRKNLDWNGNARYMEEWQYGIQLGPSFYQYESEKENRYLDAFTRDNNRFHGGVFCEYRLL